VRTFPPKWLLAVRYVALLLVPRQHIPTVPSLFALLFRLAGGYIMMDMLESNGTLGNVLSRLSWAILLARPGMLIRP
jgi:hypothetical protein